MTQHEMEALSPIDRMPVPKIFELNKDEEFEAVEFSAAEFEEQWKLATTAKKTSFQT